MQPDKSSLKNFKEEYHCPFTDCVYNLLHVKAKSFSRKKFLDQHVAKVHAEKKFICAKCGKGFGKDWWRRHHEETCGVDWMCDCGAKYKSRESLLTHARRTGHDLPEQASNKKKRPKLCNESSKTPVIFLIQPIIQNVSCDQKSFQSTILNPRPILPKMNQPSTFSQSSKSKIVIENFPSCTVPSVPKSFLSADETSVSYDSACKLILDESYLSTSQEAKPILKDSITQTCSELTNSLSFDVNESESNFKPTQISISTQTPNNFDHHPKMRESRASQCNRRKSKSSVAVVNESTCTQTAESAVVKIKRKRSRRKSVAITTEPSLLTLQKQNNEHSMWPNFKDLIFQNPDDSGTQSVRNTMSTQTSYYTNKILCDSQTITDEEFFKFDLAETIKKDYESNICKDTFDMTVDSLSTLQDNNFCSTLPEFDLFPANTVTADEKLTKPNCNFVSTSTDDTLGGETCPIFNMFDDCQKSDENSKMPHPALSDIHTQTMASSELDFNLLANMETQTTDDFALYDLLEFSDTETQTPWDDLPDLDKSPLPPDQFSIEIQTDFSSLSTELNPDPYAFFNGTYVQNMIERESVNIETQTHDGFSSPKFTNSESQTFEKF